ncbi:MAG: HEAT repeat domain-containing protein [Planctomycetota bacterium]
MKTLSIFFMLMNIILWGCSTTENATTDSNTSENSSKNTSNTSENSSETKQNAPLVEAEVEQEMRRLLKLYDQGTPEEWAKARTQLMNWPDEKYRTKALDGLCLMLFNRFRITGAVVTFQKAQQEFKIIGKQAVPYLIVFMSNPKMTDNVSRKYCGDALALIGKEAIPEIKEALKKSGQAKYHYDLIVALGETQDKSAVPILIEMTEESDYGRRSYAAESLGKISEAESIPPLLKLLNDEEEFVCVKAAKALHSQKKFLKDSGQLSAIIQTLKNRKQGVSPESDLYQELNRTLRTLQS